MEFGDAVDDPQQEDSDEINIMTPIALLAKAEEEKSEPIVEKNRAA